MRRGYLRFTMLLGAACRFGGPEGHATDLDEVDAGPTPEPPDSSRDFDENSAVVDDQLTSDARQLPPDPVVADAAASQAPDTSSDVCWASAGLACDPLSGLGCLPLMQCVIDPSSSATTTHCVFSGLLLDVMCAQDALSTNCPLQHTCVMGACRKYCCRDADCEAGARCEDARVGSASGFKLCQPLTP